MRGGGLWASAMLTLLTSWAAGCATTRLPTACPAAEASSTVEAFRNHERDEAHRSASPRQDGLRLVVFPLDVGARSDGRRSSRAASDDPWLVARQDVRSTPAARTVAVLLPAWDRDEIERGRDEWPPLVREHAGNGGTVVWIDPDPSDARVERIDIGEGADGTTVELTLFIVGAGYWDVVGTLGRAPSSPRPRVDLAQLEAELARLRADHERSPRPILLLSHVPLEATGVHGMGGLVGDATLRFAPAPVRDAVRDGLFVGAIGGHEPELAIQRDASDAIRRSTKLDMADRLFLVQAGGAARGARRDLRRRLARNRGIVLDPEVETRGRGFVVLDLDENSWTATTRVRHGGRWRTSCVSAPLHDPPRGVAAGAETTRRWPNNAPCPTCDPRSTPARPQ